MQNRSISSIAGELHTSWEEVFDMLVSVIDRLPLDLLEEINAIQPMAGRDREMNEEPGKSYPLRAPKGRAA